MRPYCLFASQESLVMTAVHFSRLLLAELGPSQQSQVWTKSDRHCQIKSGLLHIRVLCQSATFLMPKRHFSVRILKIPVEKPFLREFLFL